MRGPAEAAGWLLWRGRSEAVRARRLMLGVTADSGEGLRTERLLSDLSADADGAGDRVPGETVALLPPSALVGMLASEEEAVEGELDMSHSLVSPVSTVVPAATLWAETVADVVASAVGAGGGEDRMLSGLLPAERGSGGAEKAAVRKAGGGLAPPPETVVPPGVAR